MLVVVIVVVIGDDDVVSKFQGGDCRAANGFLQLVPYLAISPNRT